MPNLKIALVDIDSKYPNLALMKISAWHKSQGHEVDLINPVMGFNGYDKIYASRIFTKPYFYSLPEGTELGGSGTSDITKKLPDYIDHLCPDYDLYPPESYYKGRIHSLGYFTRGCIRKCPWCIVPEKEGPIHAYSKVEDFIRHDEAVLLDNNVLAHPHGIQQIERVAHLGIKVDFNQGLDARLIDANIARLLSRVKWRKGCAVRMSCDTQENKKIIERAVSLLRQAGVTPQRYFIYCLINKDIEEALERINFLLSLNLDVFVQPYRDKDWTPVSKQAEELATWCNQVRFRKSITFEEFYTYRNHENWNEFYFKGASHE